MTDIREPGLDFDIKRIGTLDYIVYRSTGFKQRATQNEAKLWRRVKELEEVIAQALIREVTA